MVTRIIARFEGYPGRYVWHCHILEHEDNEMMRPYDVVAWRKTVIALYASRKNGCPVRLSVLGETGRVSEPRQKQEQRTDS